LNNHGNDDFEPNFDHASYYYTVDSLIESRSTLNSSFTVFGLNVQSIRAKIDEIRIFLTVLARNNFYLDALCFQETWLDENDDVSHYSLDGYSLIARGKSCSQHGGLIIYLRNVYEYEPFVTVSESTVWEGLFIKVKINSQQNLVIGNVYRPPRNLSHEVHNFVESFGSTLELITQTNCESVILGDFNFDLLQSRNTAVREFLNLLISGGFYPRITIPTRFSNTCATLLDNVIHNLGLRQRETIAGVMINMISDHQGYFISLKCQTTKKQCNRFVTITKRSENFEQDVRNELAGIDLVGVLSEDRDPDENYNAFSNALTNAIQKFSSPKRIRVNNYNYKKTPWITSGIMRSIRYRDNLYKKYKKAVPGSRQHEVLKINLSTYKRILKRTIRDAKRQYYFVTFARNKSDVKATWKTISSVLSRNSQTDTLPEYLILDNQKLSTPEEVVNGFNAHFSTVGSKLIDSIGNSNASYRDFMPDQPEAAFSFCPVNQEEVERTIDQLKPKSCSTTDGISSKLLKALKPVISPPLTFLINQTIRTGRFPDALKIAKVRAIFKKGDKHDPSNFRPISILPAISKVYEKIIHKQIVNHFQENSLFFGSQYGFRSSHSTDLATLELVDRLSYEMDRGGNPFAVFIDLSKAFDCLDHNILAEKLQFYGIRGTALNLMKDYLTNRKQFVEFNGVKSCLHNISVGVPQGSVLGPLLFLIHLNDFSNASNAFKMINYADDTALISALSFFPGNSSNIINDELEKVSAWLKANKLIINVSKSKAMMFHQRNKRTPTLEIKLNNEIVQFVDTFNYLGIILDQRLTWGAHTQSISTKISKVIGILSKLKHFLPPYILKIIYDALITSRIKYGLLIWGSCFGQIFKLQKRAVRIIVGAKFNAHTDPIFRKLGILKVVDDRKLQELIFFYKLKHNKLPQFFRAGFVSFSQAAQDRFTRVSQLLSIPRFWHEYIRGTLRYSIVKTVNETPSSVMDKIMTHSLQGFSHYAKAFFISRYSMACNLANCYVCGRN